MRRTRLRLFLKIAQRTRAAPALLAAGFRQIRVIAQIPDHTSSRSPRGNFVLDSGGTDCLDGRVACVQRRSSTWNSWFFDFLL